MYCSQCGNNTWEETPEGTKCTSCNYILENTPPLPPKKDKKPLSPVLRTLIFAISGIVITIAIIASFFPAYSTSEAETITALNERIAQVTDETDVETVVSICNDYSSLEEKRLTIPIKIKTIYQYLNNYAESMIAQAPSTPTKNKVWADYISFCKTIPENKLSKRNKSLISENREFFDELYELEEKYQQAIKNESNSTLSELGSYRAAAELAVYFDYESSFSVGQQAEREIKSKLKNPSSYQRIRYISSPKLTISEKDKETATITGTCMIEYSATNSFGARVKDSYYYMDTIEKSLCGMEYDKVADIFCSTLEEVIEKYDK